MLEGTFQERSTEPPSSDAVSRGAAGTGAGVADASSDCHPWSTLLIAATL